VQLTASQQLHDKLRQAQDLLRHELPGGDLAQVLERALDVLIAQRMKQRFGQGSKPRARRQGVLPKPESRHVPNEVRRAVLERDGMRCSYVSAEGKRCEQRGWLELHHEQPYGRGGAPTVANIRVLCRGHNDLLAERDYGRDFMRSRIERARSERTGGGHHNSTTKP
jgi:5-methylcytosine-specific restriction endonuclease McrA